VKATSRRETGWLTFFFVPFCRVRNVFVRCSACGKDMIAKCPLADLGSSNPVTLRHLLLKPRPFVGLVCIWLGVLLCWFPIIGLIPSIIGFFYRNKFGRALKTLSWIGLIVSALITVGLATALLLVPHEQ
jgi:hypothetical protein